MNYRVRPANTLGDAEVKRFAAMLAEVQMFADTFGAV